MPGKIYNSNSYGLAAAVTQAGGLPRMLGIARDDLSSLNAKIEEGLNADVLITSAGVSKGDYDIVKDILMKRGAWSCGRCACGLRSLLRLVFCQRAVAAQSHTSASGEPG